MRCEWLWPDAPQEPPPLLSPISSEMPLPNLCVTGFTPGSYGRTTLATAHTHMPATDTLVYQWQVLAQHQYGNAASSTMPPMAGSGAQRESLTGARRVLTNGMDALARGMWMRPELCFEGEVVLGFAREALRRRGWLHSASVASSAARVAARA